MAERPEQDETEELNRRLIEAMPAGLVHVRIDGTILVANDEALRVLGLSFDELSGKYTQDFAPITIWEDGSPCDVKDYPVTRALMTGETQPPATIGVRRPDGGVSWSLYTAVPVKDSGGATTGAVATIVDITRRKQLELERKRMEGKLLFAERLAAVGTLAAGVAHEVNNPLTTILANLDFALEAVGTTDPSLRELLLQTRDGSNRIQRVMQALGSFSRQNTNAVTSLDEVLGSTLGLAQNELRHRARVETAIERGLRVRGERSKLGQLFLNLVINAAHAIKPGDAAANQICVRAKQLPDRPLVRIAIEDSGHGIPPEILGRIFDPFVTTKAQGVGTGLGLYVCHQIVAGLDGRMWVESELGQGTTFFVELPLATSGDSGVSTAPVRLRDIEEPSRRLRLLIVDDEPFLRVVLRRVFSDWDVVDVDGGRAALQALEGNTFDAVLCDLMMPDMTGMEFFAVVQQQRPELAARFVFVTGAAFTMDAAGFVDEVEVPVLNKPFRREDLVAAVTRAAHGATSRREP
ncbi:MAG: response regulator [Deltaproteobacteria bacterium]|nr:response regulator [Deltaproteobacteria bacterium]